jgi:hypothetical protein
MSITSKPPEMAMRQYELQEPVTLAVEKYATFIASTPDQVVDPAVKMLLWEDPEFRRWWNEQQEAPAKKVASSAPNLMARI